MKRKVEYSSGREKRRDLFAGFLMAVVLNIILILLWVYNLESLNNSLESYLKLLPWLINGLFLFLGLLILPQFALGYLIAIGAMAATPLIFLVLCGVGCFLAMTFDNEIGIALGIATFFIILIIGGSALFWMLSKSLG